MTPREERHKVLMRARMRAGSNQTDICIRDVSSGGLLVQASTPPPRGAYVEILHRGRPIVGRVIWSAERRFGIQTRDRINVAAMISLDRGDPLGGSPTLSPRYAAGSSSTAQVWRQADVSRHFATLLQYGIVGLCGATAAIGLAQVVYGGLVHAFIAVSANLG